MSQPRIVAVALSLAVLPCTQGEAQVTIDVSKITCDQYVRGNITDYKNIALWLSGYFNGRKDNMLVDPQKLEAASDKLYQYCLRKPDVLIFKAAGDLLD
jgi:hypothetical protein